jgi:hypothetical protein
VGALRLPSSLPRITEFALRCEVDRFPLLARFRQLDALKRSRDGVGEVDFVDPRG